MASIYVVSNRDKQNLLYVILLTLLIQDILCINTYQMNEYCGKELSFISKYKYQLKLELDDNGIYNKKPYWSYDDSTCETKLEAWYSTYPKLMFYFEGLELDCDDGHIEFYQSESGSERISGLQRDICGDNKPEGVYTVDSRYLRIKYVPTKKQHINGIFSIIVTAYDDDYCPSYAHECKNSRCIDEDIACNGYNSCGDDSGCDLSTGAIVGIVIGSLAGVALIVSVVVCCVCCTRKSGLRPGVVQTNAQGQVVYSSSNQQGFTQATYGVNQGALYPGSQVQAVPYPSNQAQGIPNPNNQAQGVPYPSNQGPGVMCPSIQDQGVLNPSNQAPYSFTPSAPEHDVYPNSNSTSPPPYDAVLKNA